MLRNGLLVILTLLALATAAFWFHYRPSCGWRQWEYVMASGGVRSLRIAVAHGRVTVSRVALLPGSGANGASIVSGGFRYSFLGIAVQKTMPGWRIRGSQRLLVVVPLWVPFVLFGGYPASWVVWRRLRAWVRRRRGLCSRCAYSLKGNVSGICPECGARVLGVKPAATEYRFSTERVGNGL